jgi:uncharacterized protein YaiI (UPF0178 family)
LAELHLLIDADSVPVPIRAVILRLAVRRNLPAMFVADRVLKDVLLAQEEHTASLRKKAKEEGETDMERVHARRSGITQVTVPVADGSADDYLVGHVTLPALAITHDVPLSARLVEKGVVVLDDRGNVFTKENVSARLSERNVNMILREYGIASEKNKRLDAAQVKAFSDAFDRTITKITKQITTSAV